MSLIDNPQYLKDSQYKTAANLQARVKIHQLFSTNPYGWFPWEFEQLALRPGERVLDVGCGPAELWKSQRARLPEGARVVLCDLSLGMAQASQQALSGDPRFLPAVSDAQQLPFPTGSFDVITANHMLYHVPQIDHALREIRRVLRPGGRLVAATNGSGHMRQLFQLARQVLPGYRAGDSSVSRFGLENGAVMVGEVLGTVQVKIYEDGLFVTDPQLLVDYIGSMWGLGNWDGAVQSQLTELIAREIAQSGGFQIDKSSGVILAEKLD